MFCTLLGSVCYENISRVHNIHPWTAGPSPGKSLDDFMIAGAANPQSIMPDKPPPSAIMYPNARSCRVVQRPIMALAYRPIQCYRQRNIGMSKAVNDTVCSGLAKYHRPPVYSHD